MPRMWHRHSVTYDRTRFITFTIDLYIPLESVARQAERVDRFLLILLSSVNNATGWFPIYFSETVVNR